MFNSVVFISENQITGKVPRDYPNARTEIAWGLALNADWLPLGQHQVKNMN